MWHCSVATSAVNRYRNFVCRRKQRANARTGCTEWRTGVPVLTENNPNGSADSRTVKCAILTHSPCAGPAFFCRLKEKCDWIGKLFFSR